MKNIKNTLTNQLAVVTVYKVTDRLRDIEKLASVTGDYKEETIRIL